MTTISVSLDDETYARLKAAAEAEGASVEAFVAGLLTLRYHPAALSPEVRAMAERHLVHYPNLFKRLAE